MARARKFVGLDVHAETISICVRDRDGKIVDECVIPTTAAAVRRYFPRRVGVVVTFEEGPLASLLFRLLVNRVDDVLVCNPRYNRLLLSGPKSDRIDAAKLAELLRLGGLRRVHHDETPMPLREHVAHYAVLVADAARVMLRIKALFRGHAIATPGTTVYGRRNRRKWLRRIRSEAPRRRLLSLYQQLDTLTSLRDQARVDMVADAAQHPDFSLLCTFPFVSSIRAAQLLAYLSRRTFRRRSHLWSYSGLAVISRSSGDHRVAAGRIVDRPKVSRRLRRNFHPQLKGVLKDIALAGSNMANGPLRAVFDACVERGLTERVARVVLARRIASAVRGMLRDHQPFDHSRFVMNAQVPGVERKHRLIPLPALAREARA